jgi:hypothetical protein
MFNIKLANNQLSSDKLSSIFQQLSQKEPTSKTKISEILVDFHENGILLTMLFFALPIAIPMPFPPGFTTIMGTPLIILSIQLLCGFKQISLPSKINNYQISNDLLINISNKVLPIIKFLEKYLKPRFTFASARYCEQLIGLISLICAISIAVPLPLTNSIPALGIIIMTLGLLNRDGLIIFLGFITAIIGVMVALIAIAASWLSVKYLFNLFF